MTKHKPASPANLGWRGSRLTMTLTLALLTVPVAVLVNHEVPEPYMDEVNQVQHYCRADFAYWDPKITTFPGLIRAFTGIFGFRHSAMDLCQTPMLRSVNIALCLVCALLFGAILVHLDPRQKAVDISMRAVVLSLSILCIGSSTVFTTLSWDQLPQSWRCIWQP